jgi:hypothetical protein
MPRTITTLLIAILLSACQSVKNPVLVENTSSQHTYCDGRMAWSAETVKDNLAEYSVFWIAFGEAPAQEDFTHVNVEVKLDGKPVPGGFQYTQSPEPYTVTCTDGGQQFEGVRMKYTLLLPPLSIGGHEIVWKYTLTADLSDDLFDYPKGMTRDAASVLKVLQ